MDKRKQELAALNDYIDKVDKEMTLLLQNLQWDHKHLLESQTMVTCKYEPGHRIPVQSVEAHEKQCYLEQLGYSKDEILLPDAADSNAIKFSKYDIKHIINTAAANDPLFKRGVGSGAMEPLSAGRLQTAYTADERRAIHDAVVAAAPTTYHLDDLPLPSGSGSGSRGTGGAPSREALLAELRDMRRRRARYRVRSTTAHYSDVLRDLIKTQMELYAEAKGIFIKTEYGPKNYVSLETKAAELDSNSGNIVIKQEILSPDNNGHTGSRRNRSGDRRPTKYRERENYPHGSEASLENILIKRERLSPDNESHFESSKRDRSRSRDRRRRTEFRERENDSHKRRNYNYRHDSSELNKSRHDSDDKYPKGFRRKEGLSSHDKYLQSEHRKTSHDDNGNEREDSASARDSRYDDNRRQDKYSDRSYGNRSDTSRHDPSTKHYDRSRNKDKNSEESKHDHRRKHDEYERERGRTSKQRENNKHRRRTYDHSSDRRDDY